MQLEGMNLATGHSGFTKVWSERIHRIRANLQMTLPTLILGGVDSKFREHIWTRAISVVSVAMQRKL